MVYITLILLVAVTIVAGVCFAILFSKITLQDSELLSWAKKQVKLVDLMQVHLTGIDSLQKIALYQQELIKQLIECNHEGGLVKFTEETKKFEQGAIAGLTAHNVALKKFTKTHRTKPTEAEIASEEVMEQLNEILGPSPNKDDSG